VVRLITVFACESQPMVIEGLRVTLEASGQLMLVGASDPEDAPAQVARLQPAVILVGPAEESPAVLGLLEALHAASPSSGLVLWVRNPQCMPAARAAAAGVRAILRRTAPAGILMDCLITVGQGGTWEEPASQPPEPLRKLAARLTPRERQIVRLLCRGMRNKQIAQALAIAPGTVKAHLMHIFEKTGARNRYELAIGAVRLGLDQPEGPHAE
jgi:two-component system nitrate/nitrite response regulator NarL